MESLNFLKKSKPKMRDCHFGKKKVLCESIVSKDQGMFLKSTSGILAPVAPMFFEPSGSITEERERKCKMVPESTRRDSCCVCLSKITIRSHVGRTMLLPF
jgi:hypothetical protein